MALLITVAFKKKNSLHCIKRESMENKNFSFFTNSTTNNALEKLQSSTNGLTEQEVIKRLAQYGTNEIKETDITWFHILKNQLLSPFMCIFFVIGMSYLCTNQIAESAIIFIIILVNVATGFYQEYRSNSSMKLLKKCLMSQITVKRNGTETNIAINNLVPGDIILLYAGDIIPADCRFISTENLTVDESSLTGESIAVVKTDAPSQELIQDMYRAENIGFTGTVVTEGKGVAVVIATGSSTALGNIAALVTTSVTKSNLEKGSTKIMRRVLLLIFFSLLVTAFIHIVKHKGAINFLDLLLFSAALAITAIPEGLPMVITFCLSQGAAKLKKNNVIVKRLSAIGDLGSINVFCTDKTGTLTQNSLNVETIYASDPEKTILYAVLASPSLSASKESKSKGFDLALNKKLSPEQITQLTKYTVIKEVPFTPQKRKCFSLVKEANTYTLITKGSPEQILEKCLFISAEEREKIGEWITAEELKGNRILAVATKAITCSDEQSYDIEKNDTNYETIGLIAFQDPLKQTALATVQKAKSLGIQIKILSGDSKYVCYTIAQQLGLEDNVDNVVLGADFQNASEEEKTFLVNNRSVFARVSPEQKYEIINHLKKNYSVGYMGDGINDAPALKIAHVSFAVNDAAPVAREAAEIILLQQSLSSVILGIEEGRKTIINTVKYTKMTNAPSFGHFYALSIASLLISHPPMLPMQLLFLNLLTDLPMIAISTDSVSHEEIKKPLSYDMNDITIIIIIFAAIVALCDLSIFIIFKSHFPETLQTSWFITSTLSEMVFIFLFRTKLPFFRATKPSAILVFLSVFVALTAVILPFTQIGKTAFLFSPPKLEHAPWLIGVIVFNLFIAEGIKLSYYYLKRKYTT